MKQASHVQSTYFTRKDWNNLFCFTWRREVSVGILSMYMKTWKGVVVTKRVETGFFLCSAQWQGKKKWIQTKTQEVTSKHQEALYCECNQALEHIVESPSLESVQSRLDTVLASWFQVALLEQGFDEKTSNWVPSNCNHYVILWKKEEQVLTDQVVVLPFRGT